MFGDEYPEMADQLRANVSRFSAYKANYVRQAFDDNARQFSGKDLDDANKATINQFRRWTDAELTTAGARARTAKQFTEFNEPDRRELFPCLKWLPSRAVNPRQSHAMFWGGVWRKDDDFWKRHQPGTEWNCMCDLEECDDAPQEPKDYSRKKEPKVPKGFEPEPYGDKGQDQESNNPYHTGKVFNDNVGYIAHTSKTKGKKVVKMMNEIEWLRTKNDKERRKRFNQIDSSCVIAEEKREVTNISETYGELAHAMQFSENRVLKNEGIELIPEWLKTAECIGRKESDPNHNTGKTKKLKERTDYFYYFQTKMFGKYDCYIHVGRYREDKKLYLYTIAEGIPQDLEPPIW